MSFNSLSSREKIFNRIIEFGILGLIVFTPLPAASVYEWSILIVQVALLLMLAAYILLEEKPRTNNALAQAIKPMKYAFLAFWFFVILQLLPLPAGIVRTISPAAAAFRRLYSVDSSQVKSMSLSLIPSHTLQRGLGLFSYFLLAFLVFMTIRKRHQILRVWTALITMGVFEALYGLSELYNKNPKILFYKKVHNLDSVTGTFVNRNHLSGYLEMIIPLAIGLIIARLGVFSPVSLTWRDRLLKLQEKGFALNVIVFFAVIVMALAVVFSKSRSGLFVLILIFVLFSGLVTIFFRTYPSRKKWLKNSMGITFVAILMISFYFGISASLERFSLDALLQEERPNYWAHSLREFSRFPLMGTGLGTFGALAPTMESAGGPVAMVHAHNDYLECLSELGAIGFLLLFGGIFFILAKSFISWRTRSNPEVKGLALGGIISLVCILTHSLTDFNLHIPANMVLFSIVLPLTMVTAFYKRGTGSSNSK